MLVANFGDRNYRFVTAQCLPEPMKRFYCLNYNTGYLGGPNLWKPKSLKF